MFKESATDRGFVLGEFNDLYGNKCSIQESSLATKHAIWLGIDNANPMIMASDARKLNIPTIQPNGWVKYDIPNEVMLHTRMHLNQEQALALSKVLEHFALTGELKTDVEGDEGCRQNV